MEKEGSVSISEFKHANISLILNSYEDIFSSFDARSYSERSLSVDFLGECKRAARDKDDVGIELILCVPRAKRNLNDEIKIKKRLREHFHRHSLEKGNEIRKIKKSGTSWVILGGLLIFGVALGLVEIKSNLLLSLLSIFQIPGWFLVWEGLGKILLESRTVEPDYTFYKRMSDAQINFISY